MGLFFCAHDHLLVPVNSHLDIIGVFQRTADIWQLLRLVTLIPHKLAVSFTQKTTIQKYLYMTIATIVNEHRKYE